ncbi:endonuclease III [Candidatus Woesearchaeota archaeon]|nr:endonuclease III [Candidatus Woesearchaeota archaeon]
MKDIDKVISLLRKEVAGYKVPVVDLIQIQTKDPFKVLITTILSARTKDETTAQAARRLFKEVRDVKDLQRIDYSTLNQLIYPVGFHNTKAKHLKELAEVMTIVPDTMDELLKLPGVGRKTANLVLAIAFDIPAICVDTHVHRITNRWGYVKTKTPLETEMALRKKLPKEHWTTINSILVAYGQNTCRPISPHCDKCVISEYCKRIGLK